MKVYIFLFLFLQLFLQPLSSQIISKASNQVLVKGTISNLNDNLPIGVEIRFEDETGKYFKINSNSLSGNFEQILESGKTYKVRLNSKMIFPTEYTLQTIKTDNYAEQTENFSVIKIEKGKVIGCLNLFKMNTSELTPDAKAMFEDLNVKMRFNRGVSLYLEIGGNDSKSGFFEVKTITKNKKKKTDTLFNENEFKELIKKRIDVIQNEIKNLTAFPDRIEIRKSEGAYLEKAFKICDNDADTYMIVKDYIDKMK